MGWNMQYSNASSIFCVLPRSETNRNRTSCNRRSSLLEYRWWALTLPNFCLLSQFTNLGFRNSGDFHHDYLTFPDLDMCISEETLTLCNEVRSRIMHELHVYYTFVIIYILWNENNFSEILIKENYSLRLGKVLDHLHETNVRSVTLVFIRIR